MCSIVGTYGYKAIIICNKTSLGERKENSLFMMYIMRQKTKQQIIEGGKEKDTYKLEKNKNGKLYINAFRGKYEASNSKTVNIYIRIR